ncbi:MAG: hypothetical protein FE78DRAFT_86396 [Acidomyces sp. 'richmondensis']|nr:MAG: hypothetical protein FE78DRAFT_86396 [Acidomyces sp. 'richmondensis']
MERNNLVLVLGGTGMLLPALRSLLDREYTVIAVARQPERAGQHPRLIKLQADWGDPKNLAAELMAALGDERPSRALLWIHSRYSAAVHTALDALLATDAIVVHLCGSSSHDPRNDPVPQPYLAPRQYCRVVLGFERSCSSVTRWLTDEEISDGALRAFDNPGSLHVVGQLDPWEDHP